MKYHVGCGAKKWTGWVNCDFSETPGVTDEVFDACQEWPIKDTVEEVVCHHALEHMGDPKGFFANMWRACKDNAKCIITVPYGGSVAHWGDIHHKQPWVTQTFSFLVPEYPHAVGNPEGLGWRWPYHITEVQLKVVKDFRWIFHTPAPFFPRVVRFVTEHFANAISELQIELHPIKSQYTMEIHNKGRMRKDRIVLPGAYVDRWSTGTPRGARFFTEIGF